MKISTITFVAFAVILPLLSLGQNESSGGQKKEPVIYPTIRSRVHLSAIDQNACIGLGLAVGFLVNSRTFFGLDGYLSLNSGNTVDRQYVPVKNETAHWKMEHTGVRIDYVINPLNKINITVGSLFGKGSIERCFSWNDLHETSPEMVNFNLDYKNGCKYFVVEPNLSLGTKLTNALKINLDLMYRFVSTYGVQSTIGMNNSRFSGPSCSLSVQFQLPLPFKGRK